MKMKMGNKLEPERSSLAGLRIAIGIVTLLVIIVGGFWLLSNVTDVVSSQGAATIAGILSIIGVIASLFQVFPHLRVIIKNKFIMKKQLIVTVIFTSLIIVIISTINVYTPLLPVAPAGSTCDSTTGTDNVGTVKAANGECIGISSGQFAFDTNRPDGKAKGEAARRLQNGDVQGALALWQHATVTDTNDAEALIYRENQQVLASHKFSFTMVIMTTLTGSSDNLGRDVLQGAYIAQREYNAQHWDGPLLYLLLANVGSQGSDAISVAHQITHVSQQNENVAAVVLGCTSNASTQSAERVLTQANIPVVSATASSDVLSGISPYFFRVVPPDTDQAQAAVMYAFDSLHVRKPLVVYNAEDVYASNLAHNFTAQFIKKRGMIAGFVLYKPGHPETLSTSLQEALQRNPDSIYFAGSYTDIQILFQNKVISERLATIPMIGSNRLYPPSGGDYPANWHTSFGRLYFTAFAFPDEWAISGQPKQPPFFSLYAQTFDPVAQHTGSPYGYTRPSGNVMLSYDAMRVLLKGCDLLFATMKVRFSPRDLQRTLTTIHGDNAFQGISGQISFDSLGNPMNKSVLILRVGAGGFLQLVSQTGKFV